MTLYDECNVPYFDWHSSRLSHNCCSELLYFFPDFPTISWIRILVGWLSFSTQFAVHEDHSVQLEAWKSSSSPKKWMMILRILHYRTIWNKWFISTWRKFLVDNNIFKVKSKQSYFRNIKTRNGKQSQLIIQPWCCCILMTNAVEECNGRKMRNLWQIGCFCC